MPPEPTAPAAMAGADLTTAVRHPGARADVAARGDLGTTAASPGAAPPGPAVTAGVPDVARRSVRVRRWFLFWPVVVYLSLRAATVVALLVWDHFYVHRALADQLGRWDGAWFLQAAEHGWPRGVALVHGHAVASTIAFFPALPLSIRAVTAVTGLSPLLAGLLISGGTGLTAVLAVGLLTRHFAGTRPATRAALLFAAFPGTFAFSLVYAEGVVITCVAFGLLALLHRRWWLAGALGLVATAASPVALTFVLSCAWSAGWAVKRTHRVGPLVAPALAPLGFVAYMAWLWGHTGVASAWRLTQQGGWNSSPSLTYPYHVMTFSAHPLGPTETGQILFAGTVVAVVGAVLAVRQRQPAPVLVYGLAAAALVALSAPVGLRPRFVMLAFPLVIAYGTRLRGWAYAGLLVLSSCALVAMTALEFASWAVFP